MNRRRLLLAGTVGGAALAAALSGRRVMPPTPAPADPTLAALGAQADDSAFARALGPRTFSFPADHGAHRDYRAEWWYFTGHLATTQGRPFGFQLTFFRFELGPTAAPSPSAWRTSRALLAHFALTDIDGRQFHAFERLSRAHPGIAGLRDAPFGLWLDDWRIDHQPDGDRWRLTANEGHIALRLDLAPASPVVLQGEDGWSRKSAAPGNASYYYSVPRLDARGTVTLAGGTQDVAGQAWLDREWSTSALAREQRGWDWFALQLADGASLMFYRLRQQDGSADPFSAGSLLDAAGRLHRLGAGDVVLTELSHWTSAATGAVYPARWRLRVPAHGLDVLLEPRLAAQEWHTRLRYWEGAVTVRDDTGAARGLGYVEMTGY